MIPKEGLNLQYFLAAFKRRLWYVVLPFFIVSVSTLVYLVRAPKIYRSTSLILVQPQEVPTSYVESTVTSKVKSRLNTITEMVMSRSKIEALIEKHNLYPRIRAAGYIHRTVEMMRKSINITFKKGSDLRERGGFDAPPGFMVSFHGKDPVKVRDVVADLAEIFIFENLSLREEQATGTSDFLERELERMRAVLREKEELVRQFREKYAGKLPEEMENNYRIMAQLQQHLDSVNASLQQAEDRKVLLQSQLSRLESLQADTSEARAIVGTSASDPTSLSLEELRLRLKALRSRYSDRHPDVVRLISIIERREKELEKTTQETEQQAPRLSPRPSQSQRLIMVQRENLQTQLNLIGTEVEKLRNEISQTTDQINKYRDRIESGPKIEQVFVDLRRDYKIATDNYQSLLQKKLEADLAKNLEGTQKGEQFTIQDRANLPLRPFEPDILEVLTIGFMVALGSGLGLAFLREYLDPTFWSRKDVESILELPVLASIPIIATAREQRWKKIKLAATICVLLVMSSTLLYALFILWKKNPGFLPIPI